MLDIAQQEARYAARLLWRAKGFTTAAVLTLASGIAATTMMFAVINGVLLRPLPVLEQDRLILAWREAATAGSAFYPFGDAEIEAVARESQLLESAAGVTRTISRLPTIENSSPFTLARQHRLVIVADDPRASRAALEAVRWFKTQAAQQVRDQWSVSALLLGHAADATPASRLEFPPVKGFFDHPEQPESRYAWRWVSYQAPDLVLQMRGGDTLSRGTPPGGSLAAAMAGGSEMGTVAAVFGTVRETDGPTLLQQVLSDTATPVRRSELRQTLEARIARDPIAIARVLAGRYPQTPLVSYIPSVAWANTLRLADATNAGRTRSHPSR